MNDGSCAPGITCKQAVTPAKKGGEAHQGACAAMPAPAVDVQLLPSTNAVATVLSQSADGTISCDATVNDCQVKKVQLALCDASTAIEPCSGEDPLCVFDVWPAEGQ